MKKQLGEYFGCVVKEKKLTGQLSLPIFMTLRNIRILEMNGTSFALIDITKESELTVAAMKKQQKKYEEVMQCPVAYEMEINSLSMRNAMVKNGIFFVNLPGNIFLPFLGIVLQNVYKKQCIGADKMMPATQMVFLELYFMGEGASVLKSEIAGRLHLTKTSITRATAQLEQMELIMQNKSGTEISIMRNSVPKKYYENAKRYLINPVQKIITVSREEIKDYGFKAGESALSMKTELNPPNIEEMAIYKGAEIIDQLEIMDSRYEEHSKCVKLQLWKYDPAYFAKDGIVDPISLTCTFKDNRDERIEMCLEELLEEK
ncbi:MAG: hypothetical protein PHE02_01755 [Lachnospiraceae bacterium]|nr:hypothetical protein [Lachnospiraceae bacterium]